MKVSSKNIWEVVLTNKIISIYQTKPLLPYVVSGNNNIILIIGFQHSMENMFDSRLMLFFKKKFSLKFGWIWIVIVNCSYRTKVDYKILWEYGRNNSYFQKNLSFQFCAIWILTIDFLNKTSFFKIVVCGPLFQSRSQNWNIPMVQI